MKFEPEPDPGKARHSNNAAFCSVFALEPNIIDFVHFCTLAVLLAFSVYLYNDEVAFFSSQWAGSLACWGFS